MCLNSYTIKPLVYDKDLTVLKMLQLKKNGNYVTPYQGAVVRLNEVQKADWRFPELPTDYSNNIVDEGAVHAYIDMEDFKFYTCFPRKTTFKAVIKAGTPFFVDCGMNTVAAKELYITNEPVYDKEDEMQLEVLQTQEIIRELILEQEPCFKNKDGVRVGDVLLVDEKTFVHSEDIDEKTEPIGIVGFIRPDGTPQLISLKQWHCPWFSGKLDQYKVVVNPCEEPHIYFGCGFKRTLRAMENMGEDSFRYVAFNKCVSENNFARLGRFHYLPSSGEMLQAMRNYYFINETVRNLNRHDPAFYSDTMFVNDCYWTSTAGNDKQVWAVNGTYLHKLSPWQVCYVRPFIHFLEEEIK